MSTSRSEYLTSSDQCLAGYEYTPEERRYCVVLPNPTGDLEGPWDPRKSNTGFSPPRIDEEYAARIRAMMVLLEIVRRCKRHRNDPRDSYVIISPRHLKNKRVHDYLFIFVFSSDFSEEVCLESMLNSAATAWAPKGRGRGHGGGGGDDDMSDGDALSDGFDDDDDGGDGDGADGGDGGNFFSAENRMIPTIKLKDDARNGTTYAIADDWAINNAVVPVTHWLVTFKQWNPICAWCNLIGHTSNGLPIGRIDDSKRDARNDDNNELGFLNSTLSSAFSIRTALTNTKPPPNGTELASTIDDWLTGIPKSAEPFAFRVRDSDLAADGTFLGCIFPREQWSEKTIQDKRDGNTFNYDGLIPLQSTNRTETGFVNAIKAFCHEQEERIKTHLADGHPLTIAELDMFRLLTRKHAITTAWTSGLLRGKFPGMSSVISACITYGCEQMDDRRFFTSRLSLLKQRSSDLTPTSNVIAQCMYVFESVEGIIDKHTTLFELLMAALTSLAPTLTAYLNVLLISSPNSSKSFLLRLIARILIAYTSAIQSTQTAGAYKITENANGLVMMFSEPSSFMLNPVRAEKMDELNALLDRMAGESKVNHWALKYDKNNGGRTRVITENQSGGATFVAANPPKMGFVPAFLDRCLVINLTDKFTFDRTDRLAIANMIIGDRDPLSQEMHDEFVWIIRRSQWAIAVLGILERCRAIPKVDMTAAEYIMLQLRLRCAKRSVIIRSSCRNVQMAMRTIETVVKFMAVILTFDDPDSPFFNVKIQQGDFRFVERVLLHWAASSEHTVPVLSFFFHRWERDDFLARHLLRCVFAKSIEYDYGMHSMVSGLQATFSSALRKAELTDSAEGWRSLHANYRNQIATVAIAIVKWIDALYDKFPRTRNPGDADDFVRPQDPLPVHEVDHAAVFRRKNIRLKSAGSKKGVFARTKDLVKAASSIKSYRTLVFVRNVLGLRTLVKNGDGYGPAAHGGATPDNVDLPRPSKSNETIDDEFNCHEFRPGLANDPGTTLGSGLLDYHLIFNQIEQDDKAKRPDAIVDDIDMAELFPDDDIKAEFVAADDIESDSDDDGDVKVLPGGRAIFDDDEKFGGSDSSDDESSLSASARCETRRRDFEKETTQRIKEVHARTKNGLRGTDRRVVRLFQKALSRRHILLSEKWVIVLPYDSIELTPEPAQDEKRRKYRTRPRNAPAVITVLSEHMSQQATTQSCSTDATHPKEIEEWLRKRTAVESDDDEYVQPAIMEFANSFRVTADQLLTFELSVVATALREIVQTVGDVDCRHVILHAGNHPHVLKTIREFNCDVEKTYHNPDRIVAVDEDLRVDDIGPAMHDTDEKIAPPVASIAGGDKSPSASFEEQSDSGAPSSPPPSDDDDDGDEFDVSNLGARFDELLVQPDNEEPFPDTPATPSQKQDHRSTLPLPKRERNSGRVRQRPEYNEEEEEEEEEESPPAAAAAAASSSSSSSAADIGARPGKRRRLDNGEEERIPMHSTLRLDAIFDNDTSDWANQIRNDFAALGDHWQSDARRLDPLMTTVLRDKNVSNAAYFRSLRRSAAFRYMQPGHIPSERAKWGQRDPNLRPYPEFYVNRTAERTVGNSDEIAHLALRLGATTI